MHILYSCKAWIEYIYTVHVVCQSQQTKTIFCCIIKLKFIIDQFQLAAVKTLYIHTHNLVLPLPTIHLLCLVLYILSVQGNSLTIDTSNNSLRTDWVMIGYTHNKHSMRERERACAWAQVYSQSDTRYFLVLPYHCLINWYLVLTFYYLLIFIIITTTTDHSCNMRTSKTLWDK